MRQLIKHITYSTLLGIHLQVAIASPDPIVTKTPNDPFSQTFLKIYNDGHTSFFNMKGKEIRHVNLSYFICKKILPGALNAYITGDEKPNCVFDFGNFTSLEEADNEMRQLTIKIANAFAQKALVKYPENEQEPYLIKRTEIAELVNGGFYAYNIHVDVVNRGSVEEEKYGVEVSITGGKGTLYKIIWNNEPARSPYFNKAFRTIFSQFDATSSYSCTVQLPGFLCKQYDSSGKEQLMMEKTLTDFPDARMEFESLTTSLRTMLGEKFVYYLPDINDKMIRNAVFIVASEYEKVERRSISTYLIKKNENEYAVQMIMYHP